MKGPMPMMKADRDYQREDDHRTLSRAAEIQADKSRMRGVQSHHRKVKKQHSLVGRMLMQGNRR